MVATVTPMLSSRTGLKGQSLVVRPAQPLGSRRASRAAVCSAQQEGNSIGKALTAAALAAVLGFGAVQEARADVAGLTPCSKSKAYAKRQKNEIKGLQKRLKQYEPESAPAIALKSTIERTEQRFDFYANKGNLLCGNDGLPHLIADPGLAFRYGHVGDFFLPTVVFLYVAGYIGTTGRKYFDTFRGTKKPTEKEIIIDVPLAMRLSAEGVIWPWVVFQWIRSGALAEANENITVSPR